MESKTPLKDAWQKRIDALEPAEVYTDLTKLEVGDFIHIPLITGKQSKITGFVKVIKRISVIIETSYGGWGDNDFLEIMELNYKKDQIKEFLKPIK
jgi:hypothetical protein